MEGLTLAPIDALELPSRTEHHLRLQGIHTIGQLVTRTPGQLLSLRQIGRGSVVRISEALLRHGLQLRQPEPARRPLPGMYQRRQALH